MQTSADLQCTVCRKHRLELRRRTSKLKSDMVLLLCNECFEAKREPRFLVIMVARSSGLATVRDYIRHRRYHGDKITAEELV